MFMLYTAIFFILGLIIGSFLNVVIFRLNTRKSFFGSFGGRSTCMVCQSKLYWYELIPLFSFLALRGRCRTCKTKISIQYPFVELATGFIFASLFLKFQDIFFLNVLSFSFTCAYYAVMFSILIVIAAYDLRHKIIPDILALIFSILAFLGLFLFQGNIFSSHFPTLLEFLSGLFVAFPFAFFWLISGGRWMGLGDAKLALGLGWMLGLASGLAALVLAFWSGAIIGVMLILLRRGYKMKSELPFAPFLIFGALLAFFFPLPLFLFGF